MESAARRASGIGVLAVAISALVLNSAPAQAATTVTRNCGSTAQMCIYRNSIAYGLNAEFGSNTNIPSMNYNINGSIYYRFKAGGGGSAGAGELVWNNGGAAGNFSNWQNFGVWQNSNYQGKVTAIPYGYTVNLGAVQNDNASMGWI